MGLNIFNVLFLNLPAFYEVVNQNSKQAEPQPFKYWPRYFKKRSDVPLISLKEFLPMNRSYEERYSWFILPYDGHPSNAGVSLYGDTASQVISRYLIDYSSGETQTVTVKASLIEKELSRTIASGIDNQKLAMKYLNKARNERERLRFESAYELYSTVLEIMPTIGQPGLFFLNAVRWRLRSSNMKKLSKM